MRLAIFAKTFPLKKVNTLFETIRKYGIKQVHYNMVCSGLSSLPHEIPKTIIEEIKAASKRNQVEIIGLSCTFNMAHPDKRISAHGLRSLKVLAAACAGIGTNFLSLCTGTRNTENKWKGHPENKSLAAWTDLLKTMEKAVEIAEEHNIYLGVEPEMGNVVNSPQKALQLLEEIKSSRIKIILDPANLFETAASKNWINIQIEEAIGILQENIMIVHAKDRTLTGVVTSPGKGAVDFNFLLQRLHQINFSGPLVMHGLSAQEVGRSVSFLKPVIEEVYGSTEK